MSLDLGRVQGASIFHTSAASGTSVAISSLRPQLTPFVDDAVQFPNGDVRQITAVSGSTVTLGAVLFSFKGDPGIGNATLSNIDGDSTEDGFTQAAVKGIAQAKNYYNLGKFDTYTSNGDGRGTIAGFTRVKKYTGSDVSKVDWNNYDNVDYFYVAKPRDWTRYGAYTTSDMYANKFILGGGSSDYSNADNIGRLIGSATTANFWIGFPKGTSLETAQKEIDGLVIHYKVAEQYRYEYPVIENQPIRTLNQEGEFWLESEFRKGLNLYDGSYDELDNITFDGETAIQQTATNITNVIVQKYGVKGQGFISTILSQPIALGMFYVSFTKDSSLGRLAFGVGGTKNTRLFINVSNLQNGKTYTLQFEFTNITDGNVSWNNIMLTEGNHPYPYEDYHGTIVRTGDAEQVFLDSEFKKSLNLLPESLVNLGDTNMVQTNFNLPAGTYILTLQGSNLETNNDYQILVKDAQHSDWTSLGRTQKSNHLIFTATIPITALRIYVNNPRNVTNIMLTQGTTPYSYEPYFGKILHEKDSSGIQLFPNNINPAETIGGDWEDLGTVTVGSTTLHAYQKVSGGN